ncbi:hypothetical protein TGRH88_039470 [Toxoplasma gondii]|uniref:Uncharacterized protein n=1 Tax=Toxoplasma gondii TaxID=5811 RepID=A0A7J6K066_TOXGO|nr:hypothetical protein TGRH88_039470 [Toxoplasma gondii]
MKENRLRTDKTALLKEDTHSSPFFYERASSSDCHQSSATPVSCGRVLFNRDRRVVVRRRTAYTRIHGSTFYEENAQAIRSCACFREVACTSVLANIGFDTGGGE